MTICTQKRIIMMIQSVLTRSKGTPQRKLQKLPKKRNRTSNNVVMCIFVICLFFIWYFHLHLIIIFTPCNSSYCFLPGLCSWLGLDITGIVILITFSCRGRDLLPLWCPDLSLSVLDLSAGLFSSLIAPSQILFLFGVSLSLYLSASSFFLIMISRALSLLTEYVSPLIGSCFFILLTAVARVLSCILLDG